MQVEIKKVELLSSTFQGKTKYKKAVTMPTETLNVSETNKCYRYIQEGYIGMADVEFGDYDGKKYIAKFKPLGDMPIQTPQKANVGQPKPASGAFKKDPAGIQKDIWVRRHCSWIGCLNNAVIFCQKTSENPSLDVIIQTNLFYDALCEKVDKQAEKCK
jgi:hypothetical protein